MPPIRGRKAKPACATTSSHRANTLGLGDQETAVVLDKLDCNAGAAKATIKRTFTRMPFRVPSLTLSLTHPGGSKTSVLVVCRNISRGGIGLLHSAYIHTGTRCTVDLPRLDGEVDHVEGSLVRCSHITGQVHELGILFDDQISMERYLDLDPATGYSTFERVNPEDLKGTAVALLSSDIEARMLGHFLTDSNLKLRITSDPDEGSAFVAEGCDVVLIDITMDCAEEMAIAARQASAGTPVIAVASDSSSTTRALAESLGIGGLLVKPLNSDKLLGMLAECLLTTRTVELDSDSENALSPELVKACIEQLHGIINDLRNAAEGDDPMPCYAMCQQIKATCSPIGLDEIEEAAEKASETIAQSMSITESHKTIQELIRLCERVKSAA
ncbi:MAG: PilZ domain-containing protein [Planctomycetota bacterium]|nr:PilZ domain-containing protein [Planctomycetota bacterium]